MNISTELTAFRARHKLSRAALAELLELPNPRQGGQVTVARWESGDREPVPFLRRALADIERELAARLAGG
jgi:transcriptional regulator with XRE-family HTH domain